MRRTENQNAKRQGPSRLRVLRGVATLGLILLFLGLTTKLPAQTGNAASVAILGASGQPGNYTLTVTIGGRSVAAPTGAVTFEDVTSDTALGTIPLSAPTLGFVNSTFSTGQNPSALVVQDFNGDGIADLAIANTSDNTVSIFLGNGDGSFRPGPLATITTGNAPWAIVAADFNGDGKQDLAVTNIGDSTVTILLGKGDGTFTPAPNSPVKVGTFPFSLTITDLNGDGKPDLVVANSADSTLTVLMGNGDGSFTPTAGSPLRVGSTPTSIAAADLNGDKLMDIVVANKDDNTLSILLGKGDGSFVAAAGSPVIVGSSPVNLLVADLNGDQKPDLAVLNSGDGTLSILLGAGNGTFSAATGSPITVGNDPQWMAAGDLNADGNPDLAIANANDNTVTILFGTGNGTFTQAAFSPIGVGSSPLGIQVADFNGDHKPDMAVVNGGDNTVGILLSGLSATATLANIGVPGTYVHQVQANYAGDGRYNPGSSNQVILLGTGQLLTGTTSLLVSSLNPSLAGQSVTFTATVTPASGNTIPTGSVTFLDGAVSIGTGSLNGSGVATLATSSLSVASHSILAGYGGDATYQPSVSPSLTQVVNGATKTITNTSLNSSLNPSSAGQLVTLTATVSGTGGSPTGIVTYYDGLNLIGIGTIVGGQATLQVSSLAPGTHSITAQYGGDSNFASSTSLALTEDVSFSTAQISVTSSGLAYSRVTKLFSGTLTITNIGSAPVGGHFQVVLAGLPAGVTLANATGTFKGNSYITVPSLTSLGAGNSATVTVQFSDPSMAKINSTPVVYPGPF